MEWEGRRQLVVREVMLEIRGSAGATAAGVHPERLRCERSVVWGV
jgi:hypothetical protein